MAVYTNLNYINYENLTKPKDNMIPCDSKKSLYGYRDEDQVKYYHKPSDTGLIWSFCLVCNCDMEYNKHLGIYEEKSRTDT